MVLLVLLFGCSLFRTGLGSDSEGVDVREKIREDRLQGPLVTAAAATDDTRSGGCRFWGVRLHNKRIQ